MNPRKIFPSLTPLVLAALILSALAAPASQAQRRRAHARARSTQRARRAAPRTPPTHTEAAPTPAPAAPGPGPTAEARPSPADANARADAEGQGGAQESDRTLEELVSADSYGAYVELRRVGALAQGEELKTAVAGLKLLGEADTRPLIDLADFVSDNYEALAETRVVMLFMAARPRVPLALFAVEFPTARDAAAFEPKYRRFAEEQFKTYMAAKGPKASNERAAPAPARGRVQKPEAKTPAPDYALRRVGRLLVASDKPFSLKRLRGEETSQSLADSARFQTARTRFASDSLFVYVDTGVAMQGWTRLAQTEGTQTEGGRAGVGVSGAETVDVKVAEEAVTAEPTPEPTVAPTEEQPNPEPEEEENENEARGGEVVTSELQPVKPSEEEVAVAGLGRVLNGLWGGAPRMPGAFALGARLEGGVLAVRLAVENTPDGKINVLPFLPNIVAGPPVTAEAAQVAPADSAVFFTTTLDWEQVYTATLGADGMPPTMTSLSVAAESAEGGDAEKPPTPEQAVAAAEKFFGFKFREDLIPALGNEVAVSLPFDAGDFGIAYSRRRAQKKEDEDAEPGFVIIVSLNDAEKMQKMLPRVFAALGFVPYGGAAAQTEKREGFEIRSSGGFVYAVLDRFLVMGGDVRHVRHVVDSYAARRTLAFSDSYRNATGWQAPQKLVQAYVSDELMRSTVEETKRRSGGSTDPLVRALLARLEAPQPAPASLETTNEGDAVVHEVRVPVSLIETYGLSVMVGLRDAPVITGETTTTYALYEIGNAESTFKNEKKKGRYGTLEELTAEKILDKGFAERMGYRVEVNASSDKFDISATPKEYGKSGRRSFFLDESGTMRGADHKGRPATADDPPVD